MVGRSFGTSVQHCFIIEIKGGEHASCGTSGRNTPPLGSDRQPIISAKNIENVRTKYVVVDLGFYVPPTAKVSSERLEKPWNELTTPGLQGE